ncbi:MAG: hypothetical protein ABR569_08955 [Gaiellaceae bacterium]
MAAGVFVFPGGASATLVSTSASTTSTSITVTGARSCTYNGQVFVQLLDDSSFGNTYEEAQFVTVGSNGSFTATFPGVNPLFSFGSSITPSTTYDWFVSDGCSWVNGRITTAATSSANPHTNAQPLCFAKVDGTAGISTTADIGEARLLLSQGYWSPYAVKASFSSWSGDEPALTCVGTPSGMFTDHNSDVFNASDDSGLARFFRGSEGVFEISAS